MKGKKIIIISIIINILTIGIIYNLVRKDYLNNEKIIVKAMTGTEYENSIKSLNKSHEEYANYIEESKTKIASAITDMGVTTSNEDTPETMSSNIRSIARNASSISYDNSSSNLTATNVQGVVDEINDSLKSNLFKGNSSNFIADKLVPTGDDFMIAYNDTFTNIVFAGTKLKENIAANSYAILLTSISAYSQPLNYMSIPIMILNSANVPIGTGVVLVYNGVMILHTNVAITTTDRIYGSATDWCPRKK